MFLEGAKNMDYISRIKATIDYIEENIRSPIDLLDLSKKRSVLYLIFTGYLTVLSECQSRII